MSQRSRYLELLILKLGKCGKLFSMSKHIAVLQREVLNVFAGCHLKQFVDGTVGLGGHAAQILQAHPELELLLGVDQDPQARAVATSNLQRFGERVQLVAGNFRDLQALLSAQRIEKVDGILLDIGVSSLQLDEAGRGFSFLRDGPLDMRMNPESVRTAADLVNQESEEELVRILKDYGEVPQAKPISRAIVAARPLQTTMDLVAVVESVVPRRGPTHPATLVFQALRIAVNDELEALRQGIQQAIGALRPGGRLAVISFHSLEDRIVKNLFVEASRKWTPDPHDPYSGRKACEQRLRLLSKTIVTPSVSEMKANPRCRSARLRLAERL